MLNGRHWVVSREAAIRFPQAIADIGKYASLHIMRQVISSIVSKVQATLFAIGLALVLFMAWLSDGRLLDFRIGVAARSPTLLAVSAVSWILLVILAVRLTVGRWKAYTNLKRSILTGILAFPLLVVVFSLLPPAAPRWVGAILAGMAALVASGIANRMVPSITPCEAS